MLLMLLVFAGCGGSGKPSDRPAGSAAK